LLHSLLHGLPLGEQLDQFVAPQFQDRGRCMGEKTKVWGKAGLLQDWPESRPVPSAAWTSRNHRRLASRSLVVFDGLGNTSNTTTVAPYLGDVILTIPTERSSIQQILRVLPQASLPLSGICTVTGNPQRQNSPTISSDG
jgi:hypothetical protein